MESQQLASTVGSTSAPLTPLRSADALAVENMRLRTQLRACRQQAELWEAQASAAMRSKQDMLDILGDELRNPLAAMALSVGRMKARPDGRPGRTWEILGRQVGRLTALINELLDVARIRDGRASLGLQRVEVRTLITAALADAVADRNEQPPDIVTDVPSVGLEVSADRTLLPRALAEAVRNAIKFARPGSPAHIRITAVADRGEALIRVADDGVGVPADKLDAIFEPFVQGFAPHTRSLRGLGLGLTIVRELVQLHRGNVRALSAGPDRGFEIEIRLPLAPFISPPWESDER